MTDFYSIERWLNTETVDQVMQRLKSQFMRDRLTVETEDIVLDFSVEADETGHFVILKATH